MPPICAGCRIKIPNRLFISCMQCNSAYDLLCADIDERSFNSMPAESKASWKCLGCRNKLPKESNTNTPSRQALASTSSDCVVAPKSNCVTEETMVKMFQSFKLEMLEMIERTVERVVERKILVVSKQIQEFQDSLSFLNDQVEETKNRLDDTVALTEKLRSDNINLSAAVNDLTVRLNVTEQYLRESNIEINGIPEHRSENLPNCLAQLATVVNAPISDSDILHVTRVAKLDKESKRPRTIIAKLRSPRVRDSLLAAVYNFNKKNTDKKLCTHHLGLAGAKNPVYVAEHLSPGNKALHAEARKRAKDLNYKFVWVRNGRIYVRKDETSQALQIRCPDSIKLMK
ncbi:hypothetical protein ABMA27_015817 [Loxostege sticticalis]|uniref:FP protein C-terminal domain-containing protein n=1 Tax=Loxostege sticticalis TaxID=481309 RepID=A0ABR3I4H0_LOXSC